MKIERDVVFLPPVYTEEDVEVAVKVMFATNKLIARQERFLRLKKMLSDDDHVVSITINN